MDVQEGNNIFEYISRNHKKLMPGDAPCLKYKKIAVDFQEKQFSSSEKSGHHEIVCLL